ncbi:MAG: hypothetical protein FD135_4287, partial [Comamonadaceae bacterium]
NPKETAVHWVQKVVAGLAPGLQMEKASKNCFLEAFYSYWSV